MDLVVFVWLLYSLLQAWASLCPNENWIPYKMECYCFIATPKTWFQARNSCSIQNTHLVTIDNTEVNTFLRQQMRDNGIDLIWTGANDIDTEGLFVWEDSGTAVHYTFWAPNSPNDLNDQDCVAHYRTTKWNDISCDEEKPYACQVHQKHDFGNISDDEDSVTLHGLKSTISGDVEQTTNPSDVEQTTNPSDVEQTTNPSDVEQTTNPSDVEQTTKSGTLQHTSTSENDEHETTPDEMRCRCCGYANATQMTNDQKQQIIDQLKGELLVSKTNTSVSRRKLISVYDSRPSSVAMGGLGCVLLAVILGSIVVPDIINLGRFLYKTGLRRQTPEMCRTETGI